MVIINEPVLHVSPTTFVLLLCNLGYTNFLPHVLIIALLALPWMECKWKILTPIYEQYLPSDLAARTTIKFLEIPTAQSLVLKVL